MIRANQDNYLPYDLDELLDFINKATYWNLSVVNDKAEVWGCGKHDGWKSNPSANGIWEIFVGHGLLAECDSYEELIGFIKGVFHAAFQTESKASIMSFLNGQKANTIDYVNERQRAWFEWLFADE
ncbi:hypothetical protein [Armatimonas sp.]|uniref:hypothetical protein n=1 Tax=Armatimonas sp. TaxID=1872638 RepID=UPI00286C4496|nr:hypothetical protein [Armatimonas sp.]